MLTYPPVDPATPTGGVSIPAGPPSDQVLTYPPGDSTATRSGGSNYPPGDSTVTKSGASSYPPGLMREYSHLRFNLPAGLNARVHPPVFFFPPGLMREYSHLCVNLPAGRLLEYCHLCLNLPAGRVHEYKQRCVNLPAGRVHEYKQRCFNVPAGWLREYEAGRRWVNLPAGWPYEFAARVPAPPAAVARTCEGRAGPYEGAEMKSSHTPFVCIFHSLLLHCMCALENPFLQQHQKQTHRDRQKRTNADKEPWHTQCRTEGSRSPGTWCGLWRQQIEGRRRGS